MIGQTIGPYHVLAKLGAGGMGEVYRARDTKLNREVALKVLLPAVANDPERLARFRRESQVLASLGHPNIGAIHTLEEAGDVIALVLELVEGPTLADRIARGPVPLDEALPIARQIAEALEAAHEQGIIHRDLKPANIKVRENGTVKVLDFGLAKALDQAPSLKSQADGHLANSPTITTPAMTQIGMILGTAAYMAPEQAKGKAVDKRADIWAFGCVLFEMLAGHRAFGGDDLTDTLAAVVRGEPEWQALPGDLPPTLVTFLKRCLHKDRSQRLGDIHDMRLALDGAFETAAQTTAPVVALVQRPRWQTIAAMAAGALAVAAAAGALVWTLMRPATPAGPPVVQRFTLAMPDRTETLHSMALSPDGRSLVIAARVGGRAQLWLRSLAAPQFEPMRGTEGAVYPFWSPDSRHIGFFADAKLQKVAASGGPPQIVCDVPSARGGSWNRDDVIIFSPAGTGGTAIQRVSAAGGTPVDVTERVPGQAARGPVFLPDGRRFLYQVSGSRLGVLMASLDSRESTLVLPDSSGVVVGSDHLLFIRSDTLMALPFDMTEGRALGEARPLAEDVSTTTHVFYAPVTIAPSGLLVYQRTKEPGFALVNRSGAMIDPSPAPVGGLSFTLSPDEKAVAFSRRVASGQPTVLWVRDLTRRVDRPLGSAAAGYSFEILPHWSPDGTRIAFSGSSGNGVRDLYLRRTAGGTEDELLVKTANHKSPTQWSSDGDYIVFHEFDPKTLDDLWVLPMTGSERTPRRYLQTSANETNGQLSPDGRLMAYQSDESGRGEVYVRRFPGAEGPWRMSVDGGEQPRWRRDGRELYFRNGLDLFAVDVRPLSSVSVPFEAGQPRLLFTAPAAGGLGGFSVGADGQRFLIPMPERGWSATTLDVMVNWQAALAPSVAVQGR